jgi:hypothetical protein
VAGCKQPQPTVALTSLCYPPTPDTDGCVYPAACDQILAPGLIKADLAVTNLRTGPHLYHDSVEWPIEIRNQSPSSASAEAGQVNTSDAHITAFEMTYASTALTLTSSSATSNQEITVPAGGTTVAVVSLMPKAYGETLVDDVAASADTFYQVLVSVKAVGYLDNGITFETSEMQVPVWVCNGCWPSVNPPVCATAGDVYLSCPQWGQYSAEKCVTP